MTKLFIMLMLAVGLSSCTTLSYHPYVLRLKDQKLNAHEAKDDLPLSICDDTVDSKANCYVFRRVDYENLMRDLAEKTEELKACQSQ